MEIAKWPDIIFVVLAAAAGCLFGTISDTLRSRLRSK